MANEISLQASLSSTKSGLSIAGVGSINVTQAGSAMVAEIQTIGTTTEALAIGDITDIGYVFVKNQDATNLIELGITSPVSGTNAMVTLLPGEFAVFPTRLEVIYAKATTASCDAQVIAISR